MPQTDSSVVTLAEGPARAPLTTPTGLQASVTLRRRRLLVLGLTLATIAGLAACLWGVLAADGFDGLDLALLACGLATLPWTVLGFWNAAIGFVLLRAGRAGLMAAAPHAAAGEGDIPLHLTTAVVMTLRNEDPARALARLALVRESLERTGFGSAFGYHVLSDSDDPGVIRAEEAWVAAWRAGLAPDAAARIRYRRRSENTGYKAGNLQDFCAGSDADLMLPLDADSLMTGPAILRLVRIMQAHPRLGILQSLAVGAPAGSAFSRLFQFGMRHGMLPYTLGAAWWGAECGPFWGHNAVVRIAPFAAHCRLPRLRGGGSVLSHDQVEAVLMRRAGYEVRVLPLEEGSFEDNPPTLLDHLVRDARWCRGNMQYLRLPAMPGLLPMSRFQLAWAVMMFLNPPALTLALLLLPWRAATQGGPAAGAAALYLAWLLLSLAPKLAGYAAALSDREVRAAHGGGARFLAGMLAEVAASFLLLAASSVRLTAVLIGLGLGRAGLWTAQDRDARTLGWGEALAALRGVTLFGLAVCGALAVVSPALLVWSLPLTLGSLLAVPFCVVTASPAAGRAMVRSGLCATREEIAPPWEIARLGGRTVS
ncbi:glucans biosynthesis glucosyltransferase MdoH [Methylobacterium platani]|uniref:Glucans biosynthesis glucosyltransferase H n=2 Tax=Methylobacterium platani TaxID=427683 RepID=A0A179SDM9_9HYPH|nr:glucans biosynthesis glucosyltransferase MdoH [Methylobacterium platani]KMO22258.1 glucosyl transferase family 2 [Methylobacterium platani JCM 14648]OAS24600.1 glucan biosynthesis glucosyltransferase H [Methylobacterium platani]